MKNKTIKKKETIKIGGKDHKVDKAVSDTIMALADALHSHEVALLTWVHKAYNKRKTKDKTEFENTLYEYCTKIPESENILKRMKEIDEETTKVNK